MPSFAPDTPYLLIAVGGVAGLAGLILFLWLFLRALGRLFDRPRVPLGAATYAVMTVLCAGLLGLGAVAYGITQLLRDHARLEGRVRLAELRCETAAPGYVRITFSPVDGKVPPQRIDSPGTACVVSADLVRMRALPSRLGVSAMVRVTRVGEASPPLQNPEWLRPGNTAAPWPLGLVVRGSHAASVAAAPDARAVYQVVASPEGLTLEKSGG